MWEKNKDFKSITDVVQYHTGMLSEEFLNPPNKKSKRCCYLDPNISKKGASCCNHCRL